MVDPLRERWRAHPRRGDAHASASRPGALPELRRPRQRRRSHGASTAEHGSPTRRPTGLCARSSRCSLGEPFADTAASSPSRRALDSTSDALAMPTKGSRCTTRSSTRSGRGRGLRLGGADPDLPRRRRQPPLSRDRRSAPLSVQRGRRPASGSPGSASTTRSSTSTRSCKRVGEMFSRTTPPMDRRRSERRSAVHRRGLVGAAQPSRAGARAPRRRASLVPSQRDPADDRHARVRPGHDPRRSSPRRDERRRPAMCEYWDARAQARERSRSRASTSRTAPNCGAPIDGDDPTRCAYCGERLADPALDWVASKITAQ